MRTFALSFATACFLAATLPSCMTSVTNGSSVCGTDGQLSLSGYALAPGQQLYVEASSSATGTFSRIAEVRASSQAFPLSHGPNPYAWRAKAQVRHCGIRRSASATWSRRPT